MDEVEGHRENILNNKFNMIGVGVYQYDGVIYWTQLFAVKINLKGENNEKYYYVKLQGQYVFGVATVLYLEL